ncbi:MAG: ABC transporter permease [Chloroflexota bacterium]|nr:ABC transporter permease [Chloroflexota bacterium]MDE2857294.1 ABC transporter permease [Chloroflexota bacterium]MDE2951846.1 ABC transporter permease [Chloroflexota bacterium]
MLTFVLKRLTFSIPVLLGILVVTFILARAIPGDPCIAVLGERASKEVCESFFRRNGLDQPLPVQFLVYLRNFSQGDLGDSMRFHRPVMELLVERLPTTVELGLFALLFAIAVGVPLGVLSAYRHKSVLDVGMMVGANIGVSMPVFWLGLMLAYLFAVLLKDTPLALPPSGRLTPGANPLPFYDYMGLVAGGEEAAGILIFLSRINTLNAVLTLNGELFVDAIRHLILPAVAVGTIPLAIIARMSRSSVLEVLNQDYVRTARAKGLRERSVVGKHALKNAMLPVITVIGLNFGLVISGAVLTETIFSLTGVGRTLVDSITSRDYTLVQGFTVVIAAGFVIINMVVDIMYGYLDPRIRFN